MIKTRDQYQRTYGTLLTAYTLGEQPYIEGPDGS